MADPMALLKIDRRQALDLASRKGVGQTTRLLKSAQQELAQRLRQVEGSRGAGRDSFTAAQLRAALAQLRATTAAVAQGVRGVVVGDGKLAAETAAQHALQYIRRADQRFTGIGQRLPIREAAVMDHAVRGAESSVLRRLLGDGRGGGILQRYSENTIGEFEKRLQLRFLAKTPWEDVRNELIAESPFLQQKPAFWAERIVRTELMNAHNAAQWEGLRAVNQQVGGTMLKVLVATFDNRTASDSYAVHGQIRRPEEAFEDWYHKYQHPPNRPNDRETVVPHNLDWPFPPELRQRSDGEVAARWAAEGRKGSPPPRPRMTTVPPERPPAQATKPPVQAQVPVQLSDDEPPTGNWIEKLRAVATAPLEGRRRVQQSSLLESELGPLVGARHLPTEGAELVVEQFVSTPNRVGISVSGPEFNMLRTYELEAKTVHHDLFFISKKLQGSGVGTRVIYDQAVQYQRMGIREVATDAVSVGQYAWPRAGFRPRDPARESRLIQRFQKWAREKLRSPGAGKVVTEASIDSVDTLPAVARHKWGKEFLLQQGGISDLVATPETIANALRGKLKP